MLRCAVICHVSILCPAHAGHVLGRLLDMKLYSVGHCLAHAVGSAKPDQPAVAPYRQDRVVIDGLPCSLFACRAYFEISCHVRVAGRDYLRELERYRLSESELVNRTHLSDLRRARPDSVQIEVLVYIVDLLSRLQGSSCSVRLGIPSDEDESLARCSVHRILYHVSEVRHGLALGSDVPSGVFVIDDHAALSRYDPCAPVLAGLLDSESVAGCSAVSGKAEFLAEKNVREPCAFCEHPVHV